MSSPSITEVLILIKANVDQLYFYHDLVKLTPILQAICTDFSSPSLRHPQSEEKANLKPAQPHPRLCTESRGSYFLVSRQSCLADRTHCCPLRRLVALGPIQQALVSNFCSFLFRLLGEPSGRKAEGPSPAVPTTWLRWPRLPLQHNPQLLSAHTLRSVTSGSKKSPTAREHKLGSATHRHEPGVTTGAEIAHVLGTEAILLTQTQAGCTQAPHLPLPVLGF